MALFNKHTQPPSSWLTLLLIKFYGVLINCCRASRGRHPTQSTNLCPTIELPPSTIDGNIPHFAQRYFDMFQHDGSPSANCSMQTHTPLSYEQLKCCYIIFKKHNLPIRRDLCWELESCPNVRFPLCLYISSSVPSSKGIIFIIWFSAQLVIQSNQNTKENHHLLHNQTLIQ